MKYKIGDIVEHILSKDWLLVVMYEPVTNRYLCRMKNHLTDWFYDFELTNKNKT
jgi:hypothetical protein